MSSVDEVELMWTEMKSWYFFVILQKKSTITSHWVQDKKIISDSFLHSKIRVKYSTYLHISCIIHCWCTIFLRPQTFSFPHNILHSLAYVTYNIALIHSTHYTCGLTVSLRFFARFSDDQFSCFTSISKHV